MRVMFSLAQVRYLTILAMVDDDVYDIESAKFEDLKRKKIIRFDNLTTLYDESIIQAYEDAHIHQEESEDLTNDFFTEVKGKPYTLKRKK